MAYTRIGKALGKRIDGSYVTGAPAPLRRWRGLLSVGVPVLAIAWFALSGLSIDGRKVRLVGTLHNPGPVSRAHAYWQDDCAQCHTGDQHQGFFRGVRDDACLRCHDGAVHSEKLTGHAIAGRTWSVADPHHPHGQRSAACAECHVEHRGHAALAAVSDAHCVQCHADGAAVVTASASSTRSADATAARDRPLGPASAFAIGAHPRFGAWMSENGAPRDPTRVRFNHNHPDHKKRACVTCHDFQSPKHGSTTTLPAVATADRRYPRSVSYDANCYECHEKALRLPPTPSTLHIDGKERKFDEEFTIGYDDKGNMIDLPHGDWASVRAVIADRASRFETMQPIADTKEKEVDANQWVAAVAADFKRQLEESARQHKEFNAEYLPLLSAAFSGPATQTDDPSTFLALYETFVMFKVCGKCHAVEGDVSLGAHLDEQKTVSKPLGIVKTLVAPGPRRWYPQSHFDHDAHRMMNCTECHGAAAASELTSDVLLPDLHNCVRCHQPSPQAAPANCVTCHTFHDRARERPPTGPRVPATAPAREGG